MGAIAETLAARKYIWCRGQCGGMKALYDHGSIPAPTAFERLEQLGGCAVPAAVALLRDTRPVNYSDPPPPPRDID